MQIQKTRKVPFIFFIIFIFLSNPAFPQVLKFHTKVKIVNNVKTTERSYLIQINSKDENWLSHIEIAHTSSQHFKLLYADVLDMDEKVLRKMKKRDVITKSDLNHSSFYVDDLMEEFNLYSNEYPYKIQYSYQIREKDFIHISNWVPGVYRYVDTYQSSLEIQVPIDYPVILDFNKDLAFSLKENSDIKKYVWNNLFASKHYDELYSLPWSYTLPHVLMAPLNITYGVPGELKSWRDFGNWYSELNADKLELPLNEKITIAPLIKGISDKKEIIRKLYHYLQDNTHYINVAIDEGHLECYPAEYVCYNKFGDCKALTTYMKALLNHYEIESHYVLVKAGSTIIPLKEKIPSQQFNHLVLMVPLSNDSIWLENTSQVHPFAYLSSFIQGRKGLLVDGNNSTLVNIPHLKKKDLIDRIEYRFEISEMDNNNFSIKMNLKSDYQLSYRHLIKEKKEDQMKLLVESIDLEELVLDKWEILLQDRDIAEVNINISGTNRSPCKKVGSYQILKPKAPHIPLFKSPEKRNNSVLISYPVSEEIITVFSIPNLSDKTVKIPDDQAINSKYGEFIVKHEMRDNEILITLCLNLNKGQYSPEEYPLFYEFINTIQNITRKYKILLK